MEEEHHKLTIRIKKTTFKLFKKAADCSGKSQSKFFDYLIEQTLSDPVKRLRAQNKAMARKININCDRIKKLEEEREENKHGGL
jgi:uncharacterized protein (DUF1778 family)